jgi:NADH-quinone oxidoreductase subunit D
VQGTTFFTRMDYLAPLFNEAAYSLGVERLLGIEVPERAQAVRVILMEFNRIASHLVWLATGGMELGSTTVMEFGFREREHILDLFESQSGLRMNHAYIRPGGIAQDTTDDFEARCEALLTLLAERIHDYEDLLTKNPIWNHRLRDVGHITPNAATPSGSPARCCAPPGAVGPAQGRAVLRLRAVRLRGADRDRRRQLRALPRPPRGDAPVDAHHPPGARHLPGGPVMVADKRIAWPSQQSLGTDGIGNDPAYIRHIMGESMEALINHFKLVTQGFTVPAGQVYAGRVARGASSATRSPRRAPTSPTACTSASPASSTSRRPTRCRATTSSPTSSWSSPRSTP